jgi:hypothetical protein
MLESNIIIPIKKARPLSLSIIMPAIRPEQWVGVVRSIEGAYSSKWELIIVSPYPLPEELQNDRRVKYVRDFGNPVRASNIAASLCEYDLVTWTADDAVYLPDSLDGMVNTFNCMAEDKAKVVVAKYYEGQDGTKKPLQDDKYFTVNGAMNPSLIVPDGYWLFNVALMSSGLMRQLGYWDIDFESTWPAHTDMAIRAQDAGARVVMCPKPVLDCGHMPGETGDHAPIHHAHITHDEPHLQNKWGKVTRLAIANRAPNCSDWKDTPRVWDRRFK